MSSPFSFSVVIHLKENPKGKPRPRVNTYTHRAYTPADYSDYEKEIRDKVKEAMRLTGLQPTEKPLSAEITFYFSLPVSASKKIKNDVESGALYTRAKKPDIDNLIKAVFDALNGIVFSDDAQIISVKAAKYYAPYTPFIEIIFNDVSHVVA